MKLTRTLLTQLTLSSALIFGAGNVMAETATPKAAMNTYVEIAYAAYSDSLGTAKALQGACSLAPERDLYKNTVLNLAIKPVTPPALHVTRLLDQIRARIRYQHCRLSIEQTYVQWGTGLMR